MEFVESWLITRVLNSDMLAANFKFSSPFWQSNDKSTFVEKFQNSSVYKETSLSKITKFDPVIKLKGSDSDHFALILQYHTKNGSSVYEAVLGLMADGHLIELPFIYDLEETKKALQLN